MNNGYGNNYNGNGYNGYNNNYSAPPEQNRTEPIVIGVDPTPKNNRNHEKKRFGAGAVVAVLLCSLVISIAAGMGAGFITSSYIINKNKTAGGESGRSPSVIYESISAYDSGVADNNSVEAVAAAVENTVVEIQTETVTTGSFFGQYVQSGAGSGVIISTDGYIVTNNHVIESATRITVRLKDGSEFEAKLVGTDADTDLAVIKIQPDKDLVPAVFGDSSALKVGQQVIAVGNPLGSLGGTVTTGIISALDREITVGGKKMNLLQTDTAVNPGNSGGGLFNLKGELVGIVNSKSSGEAVEGLGFAIPSSTAYKTVGELMEYGYVRGRVSLGLRTIDISDNMTALYYRVDTLGCYIMSSEYTDELKQWDRIVAVNGTEVTYTEDISALKADMKVGDTITITVVRDGKILDVELVCGEDVGTGENINFET